MSQEENGTGLDHQVSVTRERETDTDEDKLTRRSDHNWSLESGMLTSSKHPAPRCCTLQLHRKEQLAPGLEQEKTQEKPEHLVLPESSQKMDTGANVKRFPEAKFAII